MICNSYDQLTIVEKTQFIGKLMHLVQTDENAFLTTNNLITQADKEGLFTKVVILPSRDPDNEYIDLPQEQKTEVYQYHTDINGFAHSSHNIIINLYHRTKETIHRSYQKLFARLAS